MDLTKVAQHRVIVSPKFRKYVSEQPSDYAYSMQTVLKLLIKSTDGTAKVLDRGFTDKKNRLQIVIWIQAPKQVLDKEQSRSQMKERLEMIGQLYPNKSFVSSDDYKLLSATIAGKAPSDITFKHFRFTQTEIPVSLCLVDPDNDRIAKGSVGEVAKLSRNIFSFRSREYKMSLPVDLPMLKSVNNGDAK